MSALARRRHPAIAEPQTPPKIAGKYGFRLFFQLSSQHSRFTAYCKVSDFRITSNIMVGKPYDDQTNARIELLLKCNVQPKSIARDLKPSLNQIYRKKQRFKAFDTVNPPALIGSGRPRTLTIEQEEVMMDFLDEYPQAYLNEIIAFVSEEFDVEISRSTINRILKHIRITYKRVEPVHGAQNDDLRVRWINTICNYSADQLIFLNETACSGRTVNRR
jgi:transposase